VVGQRVVEFHVDLPAEQQLVLADHAREILIPNENSGGVIAHLLRGITGPKPMPLVA